jgi:prepilin-type N-terminal cleavage/methylation domain-containing protein
MGNCRTKGFTLIELLVVIAIIMIIMALMLPAINMARTKAMIVKQKSMFRSIEVGLEMFVDDIKDYPSSTAVPGIPDPPKEWTVGAQKLAEALVGRDGYGYDPMSSWNAYYDAEISKNKNDIYADKEKGSDSKQVEASFARRKGHYVPRDKVTLVRLGALYPDTGTIYAEAPVICDVFNTKTVAVEYESEKVVTTEVGTPILYYKANEVGKELEQIYENSDNQLLMDLGMMSDQLQKHNYDSEDSPAGNGIELFYDFITNPKMTMEKTPYNADGFILLSAGVDGKFGTSDDVANF